VKFGMKMDHENIYTLGMEYCVSVINHWSYLHTYIYTCHRSL